VELVDIHVIGLQRAERFLQLAGGIGCGALCRLAGEEALVAVGREAGRGGTGIAVGGGDVEVADAAVYGLGDDAVGLGLGRPEMTMPPRPTSDNSAPVRPRARLSI